jgi:hypothetical protein
MYDVIWMRTATACALYLPTRVLTGWSVNFTCGGGFPFLVHERDGISTFTPMRVFRVRLSKGSPFNLFAEQAQPPTEAETSAAALSPT